MENIIINPYDQFLSLEKTIHQEKLSVTTTFSPRLNAQFEDGGIGPTNVCLLGAKYGVGKTYFALNWMLHSIREGKRVTFFSLDMDYRKILIKILRNVLDVGKHEAIQIWKEDREYTRTKLKDAGYFDNLKIYTNEKRPISFKEITQITTEEKPDIVFIDHFGKIYGMGANIYGETKIIAEYLRQMKNKINTIFVPLIQMKKGDTRMRSPNRIPPGKDEYKGAGEVGEDADIMLSLARPDLDQDCPEDRRLTIVGALRKNRLNDEPDIGYLFWRYDPKTTRMVDLTPIQW